jgi:hypothetical protein
LILQEKNPLDTLDNPKLFSRSSGFMVIPSTNVTSRPDITGYVLTAFDNHGKVIWSPSGSGNGNGNGNGSSFDPSLLSWKNPVRWTSYKADTIDGNVTLSGIGFITNIEGNIDAGDRILLKDQSDPSENGIYVTSAGAWTRATDFAISNKASGAAVFVKEGALYQDTAWVCKEGELVGDNLVFIRFSHSLTPAAGNGNNREGQIQFNSGTDTFAASTSLKWIESSKQLQLGANDSAITLADELVISCDGTNTVIANTGGIMDIQSASMVLITSSRDIKLDNVTIEDKNVTLSTLKFKSDSTEVITMTAPSGLVGQVDYILPPNDGNNTDILQTDGNGVLTWIQSQNNYNIVEINGTTQTYPGTFRGTGDIGSPFTTIATDNMILVSGTLTKSIKIQLGLISTVGKSVIFIVDIGDANVAPSPNDHNIQITVSGSDKIYDPYSHAIITSSSTRVITARYNTLQFRSNGVDSWFIF